MGFNGIYKAKSIKIKVEIRPSLGAQNSGLDRQFVALGSGLVELCFDRLLRGIFVDDLGLQRRAAVCSRVRLARVAISAYVGGMFFRVRIILGDLRLNLLLNRLDILAREKVVRLLHILGALLAQLREFCGVLANKRVLLAELLGGFGDLFVGVIERPV